MRLLQIVLFSVLLCISDAQSRKPVLSPPVLSVKLGETAIFNCDVEFKDGWSTAFFQQIPGEAPKLLLHHYYTYKAPVYGPGVSAAHFTATVNSARTAYQLHISKAEVTDTALYHCLDWYVSCPGWALARLAVWVFSQSSKLIVTVDNFPKPSVYIFPPPTQDLVANEDRTFTCQFRNLTVGLVKVRWTLDGTDLNNGIQTSLPSRDSDSSFSLSSYLTMPVASLDQNKVYACLIEQEGSGAVTSKSVKLSECTK
ncbi:immunoglobulin kappa light chain isoform X2 [Microcaecilia unicolor]|uniref:immunoglobulin kappa light chain-like isoform X2 n=1 Tax=Microcaecilia unicolor TaxID=1415580 RepID=UPI001185818E|nr:immunoglobulin kappa light chain-like isoform X2 [Microcaecilia unicolor]